MVFFIFRIEFNDLLKYVFFLFYSIDELPEFRKGMFPKAEMTFIEDAGHWVHSRKPDEFLEVVYDFLGKN